MEYISLFNLQNQYPSINNYIKQATGNVKLEGLYISDPMFYELYSKTDGNINTAEYQYNSIIFDKPEISLDRVTTVPKTSFNFVLAIKTTKSDSVPKYFTSDQFYQKLKSSAKDGNPYFIGRALDKQFLVEYDLEECVKIVKDLLKSETDNMVTLGNHIFIKSDNSIDYNKLVQYIDWLVSAISPNDSLNGGVLKAEMLINYDFKVKKLDLNTLPDSTNANSGQSSPSDRFNTPNNTNTDAFSATVAAAVVSSTNVSSTDASTGYYNTDTTPASSLSAPTGTDTSQGGSRNYYYNVRNESGAVVTVYWKKNNIPTRFQADYAPGQSGVICAQEGTIDGNITRVLVAGCG
jgi:hypothetical protein